MKVLHITNWYPNRRNSKECLFVKEHFEAVSQYTDSSLLHLEVKASETFFEIENVQISEKEKSFIVRSAFFKYWILVEWCTFLLLSYYLFKSRGKYDVVNFHVAYPLLRFPKMIKRICDVPICVLEHWTAYHFNFNLPKGSRGTKNIRNVFSVDIPLITVSKALYNDICDFSGFKPSNHVLPNVIDSDIFKIDYSEKISEEPVFFMLNYWRIIKSPFKVFDGFKLFLETYPKACLVVGGYGPLWEEMEHYVSKYRLGNNIKLVGKLNKPQIAGYLNKSTAFLHSSTYETFSVVTAEALSCGVPVVVSKIPAIEEFVDETNGILIDNETPISWNIAMKEVFEKSFDRIMISKEIHNKFSKESVGITYYNTLLSLKKKT